MGESGQRLGVVVLNWNGREHLGPCLDSLRQADFDDAFVVVVDNGSRDGSVEYLRGREDVEVRVDAIVSLNGRRAALMIDPNVNLASERDTLAVMRWITPAPPGDPLPAYPRRDSPPFHVAAHERMTR